MAYAYGGKTKLWLNIATESDIVSVPIEMEANVVVRNDDVYITTRIMTEEELDQLYNLIKLKLEVMPPFN